MSSKRDVLLDEARARLGRGDPAGAERSLKKLLRLRPSDGEGLYLLGSLQLQAGKAAEAVLLMRRALNSGYGADAAVLENLGTACLMSGDAVAAERELRKAMAAGGSRAVLRMRLGMALVMLGRLEEAEAMLRTAQRQDPQDADISINLGNVLASAKRFSEALEQFQQVVNCNPAQVDALYNIGTLHREAGCFNEAIEAYSKVLAIVPDHVEALNNLGTIRERMGDVVEAIRLYRKVLAIDPGNAYAYCNMATALRKQGRIEDAMLSCKRALELRPGYVDALVNLAGAHAELGEFDAARNVYQQAWQLGDQEARTRFGMLGLALGEFLESWEHYQWRASRRRTLLTVGALDNMLPDVIAGMTILVIGEQGIGDELFFLRCAVVIKQHKARLICVCDPKIRTLLERTEFFDVLLSHGDLLPSRDLTFIAGDLPMVLGRWQAAIDPIILKPLLLKPLVSQVQRMREYLVQAGPPPYLGVSWRGGTPLADQKVWRDGFLSKEIPLDTLAPALADFQGTIISLQRNPAPGETARLANLTGVPIFDASAINNDLEGMLALLHLLSEYVGVSNTNMHLMAGLSGQARVLVPNPPEWRWMAVGDSSPWFPRFVLYRQTVDGSWCNAMSKLRADLRGVVQG